MNHIHAIPVIKTTILWETDGKVTRATYIASKADALNHWNISIKSDPMRCDKANRIVAIYSY